MATDDQELFLLRIWAEPRELLGELSVYRGRIEHVRSSRSSYFGELAQILPFIRRCLDECEGLPPGGFVDEFRP